MEQDRGDPYGRADGRADRGTDPDARGATDPRSNARADPGANAEPWEVALPVIARAARGHYGAGTGAIANGEPLKAVMLSGPRYPEEPISPEGGA